MKKKIAIVRGKFLNRYDMQSYEPLSQLYDITAFSSLTPFHTNFVFPTIKLFSPLDIPEFPKKTQILNRLITDAQYLFGLENALQGFTIAHSAETYFHFTKQCLIAKKRGFVKKVVVTVWENIPFNNEGIPGRATLKQRALQEVDYFIAVSERARTALLLEGADPKKIEIISPGIDTNKFFPNKNKADKKDSKEIRILFVGRLVSNKGVYELLYSLKLLLMDNSLRKNKITVTIVGDGSKKKYMQDVEKKLGLTGVITYKQVSYDDMPRVYRNADIFVAPSKEDTYWQEQWGMALMEAQASGLTIITTKSGSIPENAEGAAMLVQSADVLSLYQAFKKFIVDPKLRLEYAKKARERAVKKHDVTLVAKQIGRVYERVLSSV